MKKTQLEVEISHLESATNELSEELDAFPEVQHEFQVQFDDVKHKLLELAPELVRLEHLRKVLESGQEMIEELQRQLQLLEEKKARKASKKKIKS